MTRRPRTPLLWDIAHPILAVAALALVALWVAWTLADGIDRQVRIDAGQNHRGQIWQTDTTNN